MSRPRAFPHFVSSQNQIVNDSLKYLQNISYDRLSYCNVSYIIPFYKNIRNKTTYFEMLLLSTHFIQHTPHCHQPHHKPLLNNYCFPHPHKVPEQFRISSAHPFLTTTQKSFYHFRFYKKIIFYFIFSFSELVYFLLSEISSKKVYSRESSPENSSANELERYHDHQRRISRDARTNGRRAPVQLRDDDDSDDDRHHLCSKYSRINCPAGRSSSKRRSGHYDDEDDDDDDDNHHHRSEGSISCAALSTHVVNNVAILWPARLIMRTITGGVYPRWFRTAETGKTMRGCTAHGAGLVAPPAL